ncbi:MAG: hypothetical protein WC780_01680 [Lentimicrobiaceae bacterium]
MRRTEINNTASITTRKSYFSSPPATTPTSFPIDYSEKYKYSI